MLRLKAPGSGTTEHVRLLPDAALAPWVAHFWRVRWDLPEPTTTEVLPHPCVHIVIEQGTSIRAEITGVPTGRFVRTLAGRGQAFGIKFRPAAFAPLLGAPMATLTDRVIPIEAVFGADGGALARAIAACDAFTEQIDIAERFLGPRLPALPAAAAAMRDLVERIASDRALLRAEDVAAAAGIELRSLQRGFRRYVGVGPKWVIQRHRLHEAAGQLAQRPTTPLAALAAELGYADQAHFARDFSRVIGRTPRKFAASR
ncbi:MAG: AraC family transcriptional regulator [Myxococcales bacterium]|nr:AraC family transcriptional regulator [Myxococcales bacterium]